MPLRTLLFVIVIAVIGAFAVLNWSAFAALALVMPGRSESGLTYRSMLAMSCSSMRSAIYAPSRRVAAMLEAACFAGARISLFQGEPLI